VIMYVWLYWLLFGTEMVAGLLIIVWIKLKRWWENRGEEKRRQVPQGPGQGR
jgi:hypothetical protein